MKREKKAKQDYGTVFSTLCMGSTCCMSPGSS